MNALSQTLEYVSFEELGLRLLCALLAGLVLGLDREWRNRRIGIRTYMLVSLGSAAFTIITMELAIDTQAMGMGADPTRITQGLIGAIGFLGAGAIIQGQERVGGIATAASLWVAGAVGMASGLGYYAHALLVAVLAAVVLWLSTFMESRGSGDRPIDDDEAD